MGKKEQTIDDKISSEVQYLDKKISNFIEIITGDIEKNEEVVEEKSKLELSSSSGNNQNDKAASTGSNGNSSEEIISMSMQYKDENSQDTESWSEVKKGVENLYVSWAIIESDITSKKQVSDEELNKISQDLDNLLISANEQNQTNFIKESSNIYKSMITVLEKINYDENKLNILKTKQKVYESYFNVLEDDWESAKNNAISASENLQNINQLENKTNIVFKNLVQSAENKNRQIFFIKYSDAINELDYLN